MSPRPRGGKREAQRVLNAMVVDAERGLIARTNTTVGELLDAWLEVATPDFSPKTVRETSGDIERNLRPTLGDRATEQAHAGGTGPLLPRSAD